MKKREIGTTAREKEHFAKQQHATPYLLFGVSLQREQVEITFQRCFLAVLFWLCERKCLNTGNPFVSI